MYEIREMDDGRFGIYRDGVFQGSGRSREEIEEWFKLRRQDELGRDSQDDALRRAIGQL